MVPVAGRPFLEHVMRPPRARRRVAGGDLPRPPGRGHRGRASATARRFGLSIAYSDEGAEPIGTAGALRRALPLLGERFLVMYGDTYLRVDYAAAAARHERSGLAGLMTVLRNRGRWGPSNVVYARGPRAGLRQAHARRRAPSGSTTASSR